MVFVVKMNTVVPLSSIFFVYLLFCILDNIDKTILNPSVPGWGCGGGEGGPWPPGFDKEFWIIDADSLGLKGTRKIVTRPLDDE